MLRIEKKCLNCGATLTGRSDKKYCGLKCKSIYQYDNSKRRPQRFFDKVDFQLRWNRKLLKNKYEKGETLFDSMEIRDKGFSLSFITHTWRNQNGEVYYFCYEYGYSKRMKGNVTLYHVITYRDCEKPA